MLCKGCDRDLPVESFAIDRMRKSGRRYRCRPCSAREFKAYYDGPAYRGRAERYKAARRQLKLDNPRQRWAHMAVLNVRRRAKAAGVAFALPKEWFVANAVDRCPLLGIELDYAATKSGRNSPSVDRRDPALGYVPGNCWVISHLANRVKSDATVEEIEMLARNLRLHFDLVGCP